MSILSVQDISKRYKFREVVKGISLEITSGEVVGLLGPNGAGKTTAFYMIVGLIASDRGRILLDGQDLTALPMHRRAGLGLGYLPQEASIFRKLTVEQNILAILENRSELDRQGREQTLDEGKALFHIRDPAKLPGDEVVLGSSDLPGLGGRDFDNEFRVFLGEISE